MMKKDDYRKSRDAILLTSNIPLLKFNLRQYNTQNTFHSQSQIAQSHWAKKALTVLFFFFLTTRSQTDTHSERIVVWSQFTRPPAMTHGHVTPSTWPPCTAFLSVSLPVRHICIAAIERLEKKSDTHMSDKHTHRHSLVKVTHK